MPDAIAPAPSQVDTGIRPTARIPVRFTGDGAGIAPLSWGQRSIWLAMVRQRSWLPIGGWTRLAPGSTVDDIVAELRWMLQRYPTMRTRLRFDPDGRPLQSVAAWGTIALDVFDVPDGADPEAFTVAIDAQYRARPFDFVEEWPVRMGVIRHRGVPTHLSTVVCHLVTDGHGGRLMLREVADRRHAAPGTGIQPLEQARWQATPAGQRQNATALRHWERALRRLPPVRPLDPDRPGPRHHRGEFASPALYVATHVISDRADVDSSQVLMALLAVALADLAGDGRPAVIRPMVSNRFRRGFADLVAMVAQRGICAADVSGAPFDEALRRVGLAALGAYKYAYCDPDAVDELAARIAAEDGVDVDAGAWFNDRRVATRQGFAGPTPTAEDLRSAAAGAFRWTLAQDDPFDPLNVDVDDAPDALLLTVFTDSHRLAPPRAEGLVRSMETLAVQQALLALEDGGG